MSGLLSFSALFFLPSHSVSRSPVLLLEAVKRRTGSQPSPVPANRLERSLVSGNAHADRAWRLTPAPAAAWDQSLVLGFWLPAGPPTQPRFLPAWTLPMCFFKSPLAFWTVSSFPGSAGVFFPHLLGGAHDLSWPPLHEHNLGGCLWTRGGGLALGLRVYIQHSTALITDCCRRLVIL